MNLSEHLCFFNKSKSNLLTTNFSIRYNLECGEVFRGKTFIINDPQSHVYIMFGKDNVLYWVDFTVDEYQNKTILSKAVRLGNRFKYNCVRCIQYNCMNIQRAAASPSYSYACMRRSVLYLSLIHIRAVTHHMR